MLLPTATNGFGLFEVSKSFWIQASERLIIHPLKGLDGPEHFPGHFQTKLVFEKKSYIKLKYFESLFTKCQ